MAPFFRSTRVVELPLLFPRWPLSQTWSTLARTHLSPFARCTLGLNRHFNKNILCDYCLHDSVLYIQKILTKREMINCQKFNLLLFLTLNSVTTGVRELNGTSQISLVTHDAKGEMREIWMRYRQVSRECKMAGKGCA